jgi:hypothetical protein
VNSCARVSGLLCGYPEGMAQPQMTPGIPASELTDEDLERELRHCHEKRHEIFIAGSADQLRNLTMRTRELELEYLRRFPDRVRDAADKFPV